MILNEIEKRKEAEIRKKKERIKSLYRQVADCTKEIETIKQYLRENGVSYQGMKLEILIETMDAYGNWLNPEVLADMSGISGRLVHSLLEPSVNHGRVLKMERNGRIFYQLEPDKEKRKDIEYKMKRGPYETRKRKHSTEKELHGPDTPLSPIA